MRNVSPPGERPAAPTARRLIFCAAVRVRSSSVGESVPAVALSNPWTDSSGGSSDAASMSISRRSRTAFWYSMRVRRRIVSVRPGSGRARAAASSAVSRPESVSAYSPSSGRFFPGGGICRVRSRRTTFSHTGA